MIWRLIISDHMCMPDAKDPETGGQLEYKWSLQDRAYMLSVLARNSKTYIKFCGVLSYETDFLPEWTNSYRWTFGQEWICSSREPYSSNPGWMIMFGSEWLSCNVCCGGDEVGSMNWYCIVKHWADRRLSSTEQVQFWGKTAMEAYNIDPVAPGRVDNR